MAKDIYMYKDELFASSTHAHIQGKFIERAIDPILATSKKHPILLLIG